MQGQDEDELLARAHPESTRFYDFGLRIIVPTRFSHDSAVTTRHIPLSVGPRKTVYLSIEHFLSSSPVMGCFCTRASENRKRGIAIIPNSPVLHDEGWRYVPRYVPQKVQEKKISVRKDVKFAEVTKKDAKLLAGL